MKHWFCCKTIICTALCAAVASAAAVTVFAGRNDIPQEERTDYTKNHSFGITGTFTSWGNDSEKGEIPDITMTDADEDGVFTGVVCGLGEGLHEFKVRADNSWDDSWGEYEYALEKTMNSQTNCSVSVTSESDLIVTFDTRGKNSSTWQINSYSTEELTVSKYGLTGTPNSWGENDIPMYETSQGKYIGIFKDVPAGKQEFKVRATESWSENGEPCNWGPYDEDKDCTQNTISNISVELENKSDIIVQFDTTSGDDEDSMCLWPVSYMIMSDGKLVSAEFTGKEKPPVVVPETESDYHVTDRSDYLFFDNSQTKWDKVCAYWWHPDYARTFDLESKDFGCVRVTTEDGTEGYMPVEFPGTDMTNIPGTDIWQIRIPYNAQYIIFNNGHSDKEVENGAEGYQTKDLPLDTALNAGKIWTINVNGGIETGRGVEKTKHRYQMGAWGDYDGEFISEEIGTKKEDPVDQNSGQENDPQKPKNEPEKPQNDPENDIPDQPIIIDAESQTEVPDEGSGENNDQDNKNSEDPADDSESASGTEPENIPDDKPEDEQSDEESNNVINDNTNNDNENSYAAAGKGEPLSPRTGSTFPVALAMISLVSLGIILCAGKKSDPHSHH